jgi:hypothetical protein
LIESCVPRYAFILFGEARLVHPWIQAPVMRRADVLRHMSAYFVAPWYYLRRAVGLSRSIHEEAAVERRVFANSHELPSVSAYFDESQFERIRPSWALSIEKQVKAITNKTMTLHRGVALRFESAWLINGSVFLPRSARKAMRSIYENQAFIRKMGLLPTPPIYSVTEDAYWSSTVAGSSWFGHWLEDELPSLLLGASLGRPYSFDRPLYADEGEYLLRAQVPPPFRVNCAHFRNLWILDEFAQNPSKVRRFHEIRKRLLAGETTERPVYVHRGSTGVTRRSRNDLEVLEHFRSARYDIIEIGRTPLAEAADILRRALYVVGMEGSHLAHALYFCPMGAMIIALAPSNQAHTTVTDLCALFGLAAAIYICKPLNADGSSYEIDLIELQQFIERALRVRVDRAAQAQRLISEIEALGTRR